MADDRNTLIPIVICGTWIECCYAGCRKWRYAPDYEDPLQVPEKWYCRMNSENAINTCSAPESSELAEGEVFVDSPYKAGSIVWAKVIGHAWGPAMVDFCPEYESYYWFDGDSKVPTQYHVTFLSKKKVTRAWVRSKYIKPFVGNENPKFALESKVRNKKLSSIMKEGILNECEIAHDALGLSLEQRLKKYSFEAWVITKRNHELLQTPGIIKIPSCLRTGLRGQKEATHSADVAGPSSVEAIKEIVPRSETSTPSEDSFTLKLSERTEEKSKEIAPSQTEEYEVVLNSPEHPNPSKLSSKLKLIQEERLRNLRATGSKEMSESLIGNSEKKKNNPEDSKYLRALSEFSATQNTNKQSYRLSSRPILARKPLPAFAANRLERLEVLRKRDNDMLDKMMEKANASMYKENRERFIAEYSRAGPSNGKDTKQNNGHPWSNFRQVPQSEKELMTSDEDSD